MLKQVNKHRPFLLRYLLCLTLISPIPHSNICRGVREIFLYPIRGYSLGVKQILLLFPAFPVQSPQTREKGQQKQESRQPDQRDKSTKTV